MLLKNSANALFHKQINYTPKCAIVGCKYIDIRNNPVKKPKSITQN